MQSPIRKLLLAAVSFWSQWATFITNSVYTKDLLFSAFQQAKNSETRAIPLGVNQPKIFFNKEFARKKLEISEEDFVVLTVGRLVRRKGHLILAKALSRLDSLHAKRLQWVVCGPDGDTDYMQDFDKLRVSLPVRVRRTGAVSDEDLALYYAATDVFCLTSEVSSAGQVEGFGLVYLEAAVHGVPALGTRVGGIPDAVIDGKTEVLISPNDIESITENLINMMNTPSWLKELGNAAKRHADEQTWEVVFMKTYSN